MPAKTPFTGTPAMRSASSTARWMLATVFSRSTTTPRRNPSLGAVADPDDVGARPPPPGLGDDAGDLGRADVEPDVRPCRLGHPKSPPRPDAAESRGFHVSHPGFLPRAGGPDERSPDSRNGRRLPRRASLSASSRRAPRAGPTGGASRAATGSGGSHLLVEIDPGTRNCRCDPGQVGALGCGDGPLGYPTTDEKRLALTRMGKYQPLLPACGWTFDLLVAEDRGALVARCDPGQAGRPWAGETGPLGYPTTDEMGARCMGWGEYQPLPSGVRLEHSFTGCRIRGALVAGCYPSEVGRSSAGEKPAGLSDPGRVSVSVGRASDFQRGRLTWNSTHLQVTWIAVPRGSRLRRSRAAIGAWTSTASGPDRSWPARPGPDPGLVAERAAKA